jgi:hypothetical protein
MITRSLQSSSLPEWERHLQALGPTFVAIVVGLLAAYIAWRQWRTADHRLRFDLFERRFAIYQAVMVLLSRIALHGHLLGKDVDEFQRDVHGVEFMFKPDVRDFVKLVGEKAWNAATRKTQLDLSPDRADADRLASEENEALDWLTRCLVPAFSGAD